MPRGHACARTCLEASHAATEETCSSVSGSIVSATRRMRAGERRNALMTPPAASVRNDAPKEVIVTFWAQGRHRNATVSAVETLVRAQSKPVATHLLEEALVLVLLAAPAELEVPGGVKLDERAIRWKVGEQRARARLRK